MRALVPVAVLAVVVAVVAALAGAGVFGGNAQETVVAGPTETEVIITFTPAEMASGGQSRGERPAVPPSTTTATNPPATSTSTPAIDTATQDASSPSTTTAATSSSTTEDTAVTPSRTLVTYVVRAGDTPASIAEKLGVATAELMRANGIGDPTNLLVGTVLEVPEP